MKPCSDKQKLIAWLALDALAAQPARELRAHLETCPGCRAYLAGLSRVTGKIASAAPATDLTASETFHRRVMARVRSKPRNLAWMEIVNSFRTTLFSWRVALPVTAALAVLLVAALVWRPPAGVRPPPAVNRPPIAASPAVPAPTIANYQLAADQSLEKLDALLVREGKPAREPVKVCTAAATALDF